jgi:hypothetical protein
MVINRALIIAFRPYVFYTLFIDTHAYTRVRTIPGMDNSRDGQFPGYSPSNRKFVKKYKLKKSKKSEQ